MLKKAVSLVLVVVLLSVSSFNYVFATNENSSKMATKNDLEIMVNKTDNDNLTATIRNKSNGTQINYVYKKDIDGSSMLQYNIDNKYNVKVIIDKNNKVRT
ncbi:MAG TPA: hypothetical protein GXX41_06370 [Thermoanaerobacterium sp.]|nr:hypothetical protein [Thermoanaerobacterium sp.]